jgi:cell wall-associated NlpC family hydrolase
VAAVVVAQALTDLLGVPYLEGGRSAAGADCLGIVLLGLERLDLPQRDPWPDLMGRWAAGWRDMPDGWRPVPGPELVPGDVVVCARGVALYAGGGRALTSSRGAGAHFVSLSRLQVESTWRFRR